MAPESTAPSCGRRSHRALHALSAAAYLGAGDVSRVMSNWTRLGVIFGPEWRQILRAVSVGFIHGYLESG